VRGVKNTRAGAGGGGLSEEVEFKHGILHVAAFPAAHTGRERLTHLLPQPA
jgi:hypothetical protein